MNNPNEKPIVLPTGETLSIKLPESPTRDIRARVVARCKFHIPLRTLEQKLALGLWPTTEILKEDIGSLKIPAETLWTGTAAQWKNIVREEEKTRCAKRVKKLRSIRKAQQGLKRITKEEWEALKAIFMIQRQFN